MVPALSSYLPVTWQSHRDYRDPPCPWASRTGKAARRRAVITGMMPAVRVTVCGLRVPRAEAAAKLEVAKLTPGRGHRDGHGSRGRPAAARRRPGPAGALLVAGSGCAQSA